MNKSPDNTIYIVFAICTTLVTIAGLICSTLRVV